MTTKEEAYERVLNLLERAINNENDPERIRALNLARSILAENGMTLMESLTTSPLDSYRYLTGLRRENSELRERIKRMHEDRIKTSMARKKLAEIRKDLKAVEVSLK